jgi:hypothetical protein
VTNRITLPVLVQPFSSNKLKISGRTALKMTSFEINPPQPAIAAGLIKAADDVTVLFEWNLAVRGAASTQPQEKLVPLVLELPAPAYNDVIVDLPTDSTEESLPAVPRSSLMVPPSLKNIAAASKLSSSDKDHSAPVLPRITDGNKEASDESIIFLRRGSQWVDGFWQAAGGFRHRDMARPQHAENLSRRHRSIGR